MIQELYEKIEGDYEKAIYRMQNDDRIKKYLGFFVQDESFEQLKNALDNKDVEEAFRAAHTLKGISQNMAFNNFSILVEKITEELREKKLEAALETFKEVSENYNMIINEIKNIM